MTTLQNQIDEFLALPTDGSQWVAGIYECPIGPMILIVKGRSSMDIAPMAAGDAFAALTSKLVEHSQAQHIHQRPASMILTDEPLYEQCRSQLAATDFEIQFQPDHQLWTEVRNQLQENFISMSMGVEEDEELPGLFETDIKSTILRAFSQAATDYWHSKFSHWMNHCDLIQIENPPSKAMQWFSPCTRDDGMVEVHFYANPEDHWEMLSEGYPVGLAFQFRQCDSYSREQKEREIHNLVAPDGVLPYFVQYDSEEPELPTSQEFQHLTSILQALVSTDRKQVDSGKWNSDDGQGQTWNFRIPDMLDPPSREVWFQRGMQPDLRAIERGQRRMQALIRQQDPQTEDELQTALNQFVGKSMDDLPYPMETATDQAEALLQQAYDTYGRRRYLLAEQALAIDPTNIEASFALADLTRDDHEVIELMKPALDVARKKWEALDDDTKAAGWSYLENRPYMRSLVAISDACSNLRDAKQAAQHLLQLLRVDPRDPLSQHRNAAMLLTEAQQTKTAMQLFDWDPWQDENSEWLYLKTLNSLRAYGPDDPRTQTAVKTALRVDLKSGMLLAEMDHGMDHDMEPDFDFSIDAWSDSPGEVEEAMDEFLDNQCELWQIEEVDWLAECIRRFRRERQAKQRTASQKQRSQKKQQKKKRRK